MLGFFNAVAFFFGVTTIGIVVGCKTAGECTKGQCCRSSFFNLHRSCGSCECEANSDCSEDECCQYDSVMSQYLLLQPKHCHPSRNSVCLDAAESYQCGSDADCDAGRCCHTLFNMHKYCGLCECDTEKDCPEKHCCRHDSVVSQYLMSQKKTCHHQLRLGEECSDNIAYQCGCQEGLSCSSKSGIKAEDGSPISTCSRSGGKLLGWRGVG